MNSSGQSALQLFVRRLSSRSVLTDEEAEAVLSLENHPAHVAAHSDFVRLGQHTDHASLVVSGLVGRFAQNSQGARQITGLHIPGDMADLPSVVSPKAGWALQALTTTTILRIPHLDLRRLAARYPALAEAFWRDCVADGSIFAEWVVNVGRRNALSRLAHLLCEMATRVAHAGIAERDSYRFPITQTDLGDALGLTSVHVNRTLQTLRATGIVEFKSGYVHIKDWEQLAAIGEFDPAYLLIEGKYRRLDEAA